MAESHKQTVSDKQTTAVQVQGTIPSIAFIGTADSWSEVPRVIALSEKKGIPIFSYESANHSLETGDALECLEILTDVMTKTKAFLCKKELGSKT